MGVVDGEEKREGKSLGFMLRAIFRDIHTQMLI